MLRDGSEIIPNTLLPYDTDVLVRQQGYVFQKLTAKQGMRDIGVWERHIRHDDLLQSFALVAPKTIVTNIDESRLARLVEHALSNSFGDTEKILAKAHTQSNQGELEFAYHYGLGSSNTVSLEENIADISGKTPKVIVTTRYAPLPSGL